MPPSKDFKGLLLTYQDSPDKVLLELRDDARLALISLAEFMGWSTRWLVAPSDIKAYQAETVKDLMTEIDYCLKMLACLTDNEEIRELIYQIILTKEIERGELTKLITQVLPVTPTIIPPNLTEVIEPFPIDPCNYDVLYGAVREWLDDVCSNFRALLSKIDAETAVQDILATVVEYFPVVGDVAKDIVNIKEWAIQQVKTRFEAYDTDDQREEWVCGFFCWYQSEYPTCSTFNYQVFVDYLAYNIAEISPPADIGVWWSNMAVIQGGDQTGQAIWDMVNNMLLGGIVDELIWQAVPYLALGSMSSGWWGDYSGFGRLKISLVAGDPSDDWLLCGCMPAIRFDFTVGEYVDTWEAFSYGEIDPIYTGTPSAVWDDGVGFVGNNNLASNRSSSCIRLLAGKSFALSGFSRIELNYYAPNVRDTSSRVIQLLDDADNILQTLQLPNGSGTISFSGTVTDNSWTKIRVIVNTPIISPHAPTIINSIRFFN